MSRKQRGVEEIIGNGLVGVRVIGADGRSREYEVAALEGGILAGLLRPVTGQVPSVPLPIAESYDLGEPIATLGYAENSLAWDLLLATQGTVAGRASWGRATAGVPYIVVDLTMNTGGSEGPVFNGAGEAVGFVEGGGTDDPFTYAIDLTGWGFDN